MSHGAWQQVFDDMTYRRVAETTIADDVWVSTVWLGLNHNFWGGPPLIFETMVFDQGANHDGFSAVLDEFSLRYSTESDARLGHEQVVGAMQLALAQVTEVAEAVVQQTDN